MIFELLILVIPNFRYIGIDMEPEYVEIAQRRVAFFEKHGESALEYDEPEPVDERQMPLF